MDKILRVLEINSAPREFDSDYAEDVITSNQFEVVAKEIREALVCEDWISVEDDLPEDGTRCLIIAGKRMAIVATFRKEYFGWETDALNSAGRVTHWQEIDPLPAPLEESK